MKINKLLILALLFLQMHVAFAIGPTVVCACNTGNYKYFTAIFSNTTTCPNEPSLAPFMGAPAQYEKPFWYNTKKKYKPTNQVISLLEFFECYKIGELVDTHFFNQELGKIKKQQEKDRKLIFELTKKLQEQIDKK